MTKKTKTSDMSNPEIPDVQYIGSKLKAARLHFGFTYVHVAEHIGCSFQTIARIEDGKVLGKFFLFYLIFLQANGLDLNSLFCFKKLNFNYSSKNLD